MTALMLNKRKRSSDAVSDSGTCQTEQTEASTPRREVDEKYGVQCCFASAPCWRHVRLTDLTLDVTTTGLNFWRRSGSSLLKPSCRCAALQHQQQLPVFASCALA